MNRRLSAAAIACAVALVMTPALAADEPGEAATYAAGDFTRVRKFDAHVHANTDDHTFLDVAREDGFEILSINVDYTVIIPTLATQARVAHEPQAADPKHFHFAAAFSMKRFGGPNWTQDTTRAIDADFVHGALAVKVWTNIGMVERNAAGKLIMLDDPGFDGVMAHLEA